YCAAEIAEEYSALSKKIITYLLLAVLCIHALLPFCGVPVTPCLLSMACHVAYGTLLPAFPFVEPVSGPCLASLAAVALAHYTWFGYFKTEYTPMFQVTGFFLVMIWSVPLGFFVSLSVGDDALPALSGGERVGAKGGAGGHHNVFKSLFDKAKGGWDSLMQTASPGLGKHR
ncbi:hypothetical protein TeGR_g3451, partial [Tetraparma gracilis]